MKNSYDIVIAIQKKIEDEHESGYEIQKILISVELYNILAAESKDGTIRTLLGYPVEIDLDVKTFGLVMYNMLN